MKKLAIIANVGVIGIIVIIPVIVSTNIGILFEGLLTLESLPPVLIIAFDLLVPRGINALLIFIGVILFCIFNIVAIAAQRAFGLKVLAIVANAFLLACNLLLALYGAPLRGAIWSTLYLAINLGALVLIRKAFEKEKKLEELEEREAVREEGRQIIDLKKGFRRITLLLSIVIPIVIIICSVCYWWFYSEWDYYNPSVAQGIGMLLRFGHDAPRPLPVIGIIHTFLLYFVLTWFIYAVIYCIVAGFTKKNKQKIETGAEKKDV